MKAGKTRESYLKPEPKQPEGSPFYPRHIKDKNGVTHTIQDEDHHKRSFPEDHGELLAEEGSLHWEPKTT